jgi:hypothetical protein
MKSTTLSRQVTEAMQKQVRTLSEGDTAWHNYLDMEKKFMKVTEEKSQQIETHKTALNKNQELIKQLQSQLHEKDEELARVRVSVIEHQRQLGQVIRSKDQLLLEKDRELDSKIEEHDHIMQEEMECLMRQQSFQIEQLFQTIESKEEKLLYTAVLNKRTESSTAIFKQVTHRL